MICWSHLHSDACSSLWSAERISRMCNFGMCKLQNMKLGYLQPWTDDPHFIYSCFKNTDKCKRHSHIPLNDFQCGKWEYFQEAQKASKWSSRNRKVTKLSPDAAGQSWESLPAYNGMNRHKGWQLLCSICSSKNRPHSNGVMHCVWHHFLHEKS